MLELVISPKNQDGKGRAFRAGLVTAVMADALWEMGAGSDKHDRPIYAVFAASEGEIRPFVSNLLCGRLALPLAAGGGYRRRGSDSGYEFMRSAGYKAIYQRHEEGVLATVFLPEFVTLDPGMVDPQGIKFVVIAGASFLAREAVKMPVDEIVSYAKHLPVVEDENEPAKDYRGHVPADWVEPLSRQVLADWVPLSYLFTLYLSNRSRAPIPPDGRFYLQLLLACLKRGLASFPSAQSSYGGGRAEFGYNTAYKFSEEGGLAPAIAFTADHAEVEALLAAECAEYFKRTEGK